MALYGTLDIPVVSMAFGPGAGYGHCERLGPVVGGVLGCVPHVAVVGSVGFILQTASSDEFRIAMLSMPLGMLCNSFLSEKGVTPGTLRSSKPSLSKLHDVGFGR